MHRDLGLGQREIARALEMGQATVHDYLRRWEASGLGWPLEAGLSDAQLEVKRKRRFNPILDAYPCFLLSAQACGVIAGTALTFRSAIPGSTSSK